MTSRSSMKNSLKKISVYLMFALIIVLFPVLSLAQLSEEERSYYFDDARISSSPNTIKLDLLWLSQKELSVHWEHNYSRHVSFEAALGYLMPEYQHSLWSYLFLEEYKRQYYPSGFSVFLQNKFYTKAGFKSTYFHIGIKHRRFSTMSSMDYLTGPGIQWVLGDRIKLDLNASLCVRTKKRKSNDKYGYQDGDEFMTDLPISLRIGYILK